MEIDEEKVSKFLLFQINRKVVNLYKKYLFLLEDLKNPPYNLKEDEYKRIRKQVLDSSNDCLREIDEDFKQVKISLK